MAIDRDKKICLRDETKIELVYGVAWSLFDKQHKLMQVGETLRHFFVKNLTTDQRHRHTKRCCERN
jgi:hypothetical protein